MAGLYIHIPFCAQRCAYCDFYKSTDRKRMSGLAGALKREMEFRRGDVPGGRLSSVYVGGGTPSLLPPEELRSLTDKAAELWDCTRLWETTLEANPEDLTGDYIARLAETGFDRLSIGVQSFDDGLLKFMNRRHSARRAADAVKAARKAGFGNITIDLIFGIPGMTPAQWERTLGEAIDLGVQHISAYHLTIEPGTAFGRMAGEGKITPVPETESERQYDTLRRRLGDAGFEHYEISNFARPGFRAVHNSAYWSGEPYLGIGPSAHSFDGERTRSWAAADVADYLEQAGTDAIYESETLSDTDLFNEYVMTSLRCAAGIGTDEMERRFGRAAVQAFTKRAQGFLDNGSLSLEGGRIFVPPGKFLMSDYIISTLFAIK